MDCDARRVGRGRGPRYIEVDVDVGSSKTAANVVGLVQGALKSLVIDIAVLLEGHSTVWRRLCKIMTLIAARCLHAQSLCPGIPSVLPVLARACWCTCAGLPGCWKGLLGNCRSALAWL